MPTPARIHDLIARDDHERLMKELVRDETPLPLSARLILSDEEGIAPVVESLALVRVVDAGYRPSRQATALASRVIGSATHDLMTPLWDDATDHAWARRAAALVALASWRKRMDLLRKLGVELSLPAPLQNADDTASRLTDALASWLHAQLAIDAPLEATPLRVTLLWLLSERAPEALHAPLERLRERLAEAGTAHHPMLGELFVCAGTRAERVRSIAAGAPALTFHAA